MHAPAVLQHYLVSIHSKGVHHEAIEIARFLRDHLPGEDVKHHILDDKGGNAVNFLHTITQNPELTLKPLAIPKAIDPDHHQCCEAIAKYMSFVNQPALISQFKVESLFLTPTVGSGIKFEGKPNDVGSLTHAMLLVGYRTTKDGQYFFLLQNWWKDRYFIEVSSEYLAAATPQIHFVFDVLHKIPDFFKPIVASYAETSLDSAEDSVCDMTHNKL
jgi:hypothetical protein